MYTNKKETENKKQKKKRAGTVGINPDEVENHRNIVAARARYAI